MQAVEARLTGESARALECLDQVLDQAPHLTPAYQQRAALLAALGRYQDSLTDCATLLTWTGATPELLTFRDDIYTQAIQDLSEQLQQDPLDQNYLLQCTNLALAAEHYEEADQYCQDLLHLQPEQPQALSNRGQALLMLNRHEQALTCYQTLTQCYPQEALGWFNLGNVLKSLARLEEAIAAYQHATAQRPDFAEAQLEIGLCHLMAGRYREAWPLYEWRWQTAQMRPHYLSSPAPLWLGQENLHDKTLLVWAEQGMGDSIQFMRYLPLLAPLVGRLIFRAPAGLHGLTHSLMPSLSLLGHEAPLPPHDAHCPLMSLPLALNLAEPPTMTQAYLQADPKRVAHWQTQLGGTRRRIGLNWAGRQAGIANTSRNIPLSALAVFQALTTELDTEIIGLQKEVPASDTDTLERWPTLNNVGPWFDDYSTTAAIIANLDLVISADSSIAHLCGALGKPCLLLLSRTSEWRWQAEGHTTPWYPSIHIYRKPIHGDWQTPIEQVASAVRAFLPATPN